MLEFAAFKGSEWFLMTNDDFWYIFLIYSYSVQKVISHLKGSVDAEFPSYKFFYQMNYLGYFDRKKQQAGFMGLLYSSKIINATFVEKIYKDRIDEVKDLTSKNVSAADLPFLLGTDLKF